MLPVLGAASFPGSRCDAAGVLAVSPVPKRRSRAGPWPATAVFLRGASAKWNGCLAAMHSDLNVQTSQTFDIWEVREYLRAHLVPPTEDRHREGLQL